MLGFQQCQHIYENITVSATELSCTCTIIELDITIRTTNAFVLGLKTVDEKFAVFYDITKRLYLLYAKTNSGYIKTDIVFKNLHAYCNNIFFAEKYVYVVNSFGTILRAISFSARVFPCVNTFLREATESEHLEHKTEYLKLDLCAAQSNSLCDEHFIPISESERIFVTESLSLDFQSITEPPRTIDLELCKHFLNFLPEPKLQVMLSKFSRFSRNSETLMLTHENAKKVLETCAKYGIDLAIPVKHLHAKRIEAFDIDSGFQIAASSTVIKKLKSESFLTPSWTQNTHLYLSKQKTNKSRNTRYLAYGKSFLQSGLSLDLTGINPESFILLPGSAVYRKKPRA